MMGRREGGIGLVCGRVGACARVEPNVRICLQAHDLYIWNGTEALALTKAVALTKCFELERFLLSDKLGAIHHLHAAPSAPALWVGSEAPISQRNHLLSLLKMHTGARTIPCASLLSAMLPSLSPLEAHVPSATPADTQRHFVAPAVSTAGIVTDLQDLGAIACLPQFVPADAPTLTANAMAPPPAATIEAATNEAPFVSLPRMKFCGRSTRAAAITSPSSDASLDAPSGELPTAPDMTLRQRFGTVAMPDGLKLGIARVEEMRANNVLGADPHESRATKLRHFDAICSQIDPQLYLGSEMVARELHTLRVHGVTHVLNTAGLLCDNYHSAALEYKTLHLYDTPAQVPVKHRHLTNAFARVAASPPLGPESSNSSPASVTRSPQLSPPTLLPTPSSTGHQYCLL